MKNNLTTGEVRLMKARCEAQIALLQSAANGTDADDFRRAIEIDVMIYQAALASLENPPVAIEVPDEPKESDCPEWIADSFSWKCGAGWMRDTILSRNAKTGGDRG